MTRKDMINKLSEKGYKRSDCSEVIEDIIQMWIEALANGDKITLRGFGTFEVKVRPASNHVDVNTGERKILPPYNRILFTAGDNLKTIVNPQRTEKS